VFGCGCDGVVCVRGRGLETSCRYNDLGASGAAALSSLGGLTGLQTLHLGLVAAD